MAHCTPQNVGMGAQYESTVVGQILSISCMKKNDAPPFDFFDKPSHSTKAEIEMTESRIHTVRKQIKDLYFCLLLSKRSSVYTSYQCFCSLYHSLEYKLVDANLNVKLGQCSPKAFFN